MSSVHLAAGRSPQTCALGRMPLGRQKINEMFSAAVLTVRRTVRAWRSLGARPARSERSGVPRPSVSPTSTQATNPPPHRESPAVGNGEDGRAATAETRRQGKNRPLHPRRYARSGDIRQSEELSHVFVPCLTDCVRFFAFELEHSEVVVAPPLASSVSAGLKLSVVSEQFA